MNEKAKILIVGGGVAGLTAAERLVDNGRNVCLLEKEERVGGLARTFRYGEYTFDIGPHRFYSTNQEVMEYIKQVIDSPLNTIERYSAVYYCDQYHTWPLRLKSVFQLPLSVSIPSFFDLFTKEKYKKLKEPSFKNFILGKYGKTLYETFFKVYTEKFLGISPEQVHFHWAKIGVERATIDEKIKTGSISQLFALMLMPRPRQLNFLYPFGGCDVFAEKLKSRIIAGGGEVITGATPTKISHDGKNILEVEFGERRFEPELVVWTAPIDELFKLLGIENPNLTYLPLIIYNVELSEPPVQSYQWCYFGSKDQVFSRSTNPAQFDEGCVPGGKGALCVEATCRPDSDTWRHPEKLNDKVIEGLVKTKSISSKSVIKEIHVERVPNTYPVYDIDYVEKLSVVKEKLKKFENLFLAGRTGLFWYNNMDHSIENAFCVVKKVLEHSPETAHKRQLEPLHLGAAAGDPSCVTT